MTDENAGLTRQQRRLLRRIFNSRATPIIANEKPFLTYKEAARHLLCLSGEDRDAAYMQMKLAAEEAAGRPE